VIDIRKRENLETKEIVFTQILHLKDGFNQNSQLAKES